METASWETSKENVQPIKSGRSTKGLSNVLSKSQDTDMIENVIQDFEKQLKTAMITGADRLDIYVRYFKWTRDQFPSSASKAMQILEKCTADLTKESKYKNDVRFVQMWVEYVS